MLFALSLPTITNAFLFGVTLTNAAGTAIAAANPAQTAGIIGLGVLGTALGAAGLAALQPRAPTVTVIPGRRRPKTRGRGRRYRGRRQALFGGADSVTNDGLTEAFNEIFLEIEKKVMDGCFQRLICDISARPEEFKDEEGKSFQLISAIEIATLFKLQPKAMAVAKKISAARKIGEAAGDVRACEVTFKKCPWTGTKMQEAIQEFQAKYD